LLVAEHLQCLLDCHRPHVPITGEFTIPARIEKSVVTLVGRVIVLTQHPEQLETPVIETRPNPPMGLRELFHSHTGVSGEPPHTPLRAGGVTVQFCHHPLALGAIFLWG
jgi:hypothetical protein